MSQHIEWAETDLARTEVTTPLQVHLDNPESAVLSTDNAGWGAAIFLDEVAIYASTPEELLTWVEKVQTKVRSIVHNQKTQKSTTYLVANTGGLELPSYQSFSDGNKAYWRYAEDATDLQADEYGNRVDLLVVDGDFVECVATTAAPTDEV